MEDFKIARMFRDSRVGTIGAGTSEIMREIIAKMVIDDKNYQAAAPVPTKVSVMDVVSRESTKDDKANAQTLATESKDIWATIVGLLEGMSARRPAFGYSIRFDAEGKNLHLDGTSATNIVTTEPKAADCIVTLSQVHLHAILNGELSATNAFMNGAMQVEGKMGVALKLSAFLG